MGNRIKYLLDTNICVHFLNAKHDIAAKISAVGFENCFISELTLLELLYGISCSSSLKKAENLQKFELFKRFFQDRTLVISACFEIFANQKAQLRKNGTLISDFDLLIGCTAIYHDCSLVSGNIKEMNRISDLQIENWLV